MYKMNKNNYQNNMVRIQQLLSFLLEKDFLNKIKVTLWMLFLFRVLSCVPVPGLDQTIIKNIFSGYNMIGNFNFILGTGVERLSIMSIGISSYISASLLFQVLSLGSEYFKELKKDAIGKAAINNYIKYFAFVHAFFMSLGGSYFLYSKYPNLFLFPCLFYHLSTALIVACGSLVAIWISDQISLRGIGRGSSLLIFVNIVSRIPDSISVIIENLKNSSLTWFNFFVFLFIMASLLFIITFVERINKQILVNNVFHKKMFTQNLPNNYLTIKFNPAGIYPSMFMSIFFHLPIWLLQIWDFSKYKYGAMIYDSLQNQGYCSIIFKGLIILFTSYIYAEMLFNPEEKAKEFKSRSVIPGQKPGISTESFLRDRLFYMSFYGAMYLVLICCLPLVFHIYLQGIYHGEKYKAMLDLFAISGSSLVILVGVANDFIDKVNAGLQSKLIEYTMKILRRGGGF